MSNSKRTCDSESEGLILLLTGGVSARMGRPKALLPLLPGSPLSFLQTLEARTREFPVSRAVVTSLEPETLGIELPAVRQLRPELGQLSSILLGWEHFGKGKSWLMVCLVDHPYVELETYRSLYRAREEEPSALMWSVSYQKRGGHPVIFSAELMERLKRTPLESGARPVVRELGSQRCFVEVDDPAVLWDVDTPQDYQSSVALALERALATR